MKSYLRKKEYWGTSMIIIVSKLLNFPHYMYAWEEGRINLIKKGIL